MFPMNILFLTVYRINTISERGIYTDLLRKFRDEGHQVHIVTPAERRYKEKTTYVEEEGFSMLKVKTLNIQKTNFIEKGIANLLLEHQYNHYISKYFKNIKFDLILYSTPPITFSNVVASLKKRDKAMSYLLLKDIFPQNAVDLSLIRSNGWIHKFFKRKEKQLYRQSDFIGCMSPANVTYLLTNHKQIPADKIEVCPNSIEPITCHKSTLEHIRIREQYQIPKDAVVVVYGGNLGKPQGLSFLPEILETNKHRTDCFFLIIGSGTEKQKLEKWMTERNVSNAKLLSILPKEDYDKLLQACDIGLIMLDRRFTIPNFPSRLLSYLECKMPVLVVTDKVSDMGEIAEENQFGFFSEHGDLSTFNRNLNEFLKTPKLVETMGENGYQFMIENYTVTRSYEIIMNHFSQETHV